MWWDGNLKPKHHCLAAADALEENGIRNLFFGQAFH